MSYEESYQEMISMRSSGASNIVDQVIARRIAANAATVKATLTPKPRRKRTRHEVETLEFLGAARRFIRAAGRRVADADEHELAALIALQVDLDAAIAVAVKGQRSYGRSWAHIATATGTTRQAAQQRWSKE